MDLTPIPPGIDTLVDTATADVHSVPRATALADGGFVIVWSASIGAYTYGIKGQRYDADGRPVGSEFTAGTGGRDAGNSPSVVALNDGGFTVTYSSWQHGTGPSLEIFSRRFAADGSPVDGETDVSLGTSDLESHSDAVGLNDGGYLVTWFGTGAGEDAYNVYGQRFAADNSRVGGSFLITTTTVDYQELSRATVLNDGSIVVTWISAGEDGSGSGMYGQRFGIDGSPVGSEFRISATTDGDQTNVAGPDGRTLVSLTNGDVMQAWTGDGDIRSRQVDIPDTVNPTVTAVIAQDNALTNATTVHYLVTFSEPVAGVDASGFTLNTSGVAGAAITSVTPVPASGGMQYAVTVDTGSGDGTVALSLTGTGITDLAGNPIGGLLQPQTILSPGGAAYGAEVGDLNGDGNLDIAVTNADVASVSVFIGNGDGTFGAQTSYAAGNGPTDVAIGDLNGDGNADLVVSNATSNSVSVLIGHGDGTFQPQVAFGTQAQTQSVALADLNGDGDLDIVTANERSSSVSVLLGNGDGTFQTQVAYGVGINPFEAETGDLNGDGKLDLAVVNYWTNSVSVLLGNGDGTFKPQSVLGVQAGPVSVAVAEFNGDCFADLVVSNHDSDSISVLIGNGDGTFLPQVTYSTGDGPREVLAVDVNGDGKLDLATSSFYSDDLSVLLGNGDGTFQPLTKYATGDGPYGLAIGDLDGDGRSDFVAANLLTGAVSVLLNGMDALDGPSYTIDKTAPAITSGAAATVEENHSTTAPVYTATVAAPDTEAAMAWSLTGDDASLFAIDGTGHVTFNSTPDFEAPQDAGLDNTYNITVHANDGANDTAKDVAITVTDVFDPVTYGPEFIANTTAEDNQWWASVAGLSGGGYVITWMSPDSSASGLKGRVFDAAGHPAGNEFAINTVEGSEQIHPIVTGLSGGGFVATWMSSIGDGEQYCIRGRIFDSSGNSVSDDFVVNTTVEGPQYFPRVSPLQTGGFVEIWESRDTTDGSGMCVRARIFDADGTPAASDFIVNSTTLDNQMTPSVTVLEGGRFVATYYSSEAGDGSVGCIRARIFDAAGTALGPDFIVNSTSDGDQEEPQVSALAGGGFVETWTSYSSYPGSAAQIRARIFDADGNPAGLDFQVNSTETGREIEPEITALSSGGFVATWTAYPRADGTGGDGSSGCIRARVFDAAGLPLSDDFIVNAVTVEDQYAPRIAETADGTIVITWFSYDAGDGSGTCIRAISFNPDGTGLTVNGTADADIITGSPFADVISGHGGGDTIWAGSGDDLINGGADADTMYGGEGDDTFEVNNVSDNPVEYAGAGTDTVVASFSYTLSGNIENLTLAAGVGVINGTGSTSSNVLTGNESNNRLTGLGGNDTLIGGAGDNILNGGADLDTADYSAAPGGVVVNVPLGMVENGYGGTDTVIGIENFIGSAWNDSFIGGAGSHEFRGGEGSDTLDYSIGPDGVSVSVNSGSAVNAYGGTDTFSSIENVVGSDFDDTITGNGNSNMLSGNDGDDALKGGSGADGLDGGTGDDLMVGGSGNDVLDGGAGSDRLSGGSGDDKLIASGGDDSLTGGSGIDTADFSAIASGGVTARLWSGRGFLANGDRLVISQVENLTGTALDDRLSGDDRANVILGGSGDDALSGGGGNDALAGGFGDDTIIFSGAWADFTITDNGLDAMWGYGQEYIVTDNRIGSPEGSDTTWNFETWKFANGTFAAADILNDAPVDIALSASTVNENAADGTLVAAITSADADTPLGDTATYTLTDDAGGRFAVSGGNLVVADGTLLDFEAAGSHDITMRVTDAHGAFYDETFTITLNDLPGVTITGTSGADLIDATHTAAGQPLPTAEGDIINGLGGNDAISGLGGDDTISGGAGADTLQGGSGIDTLAYAGSGFGVVISLATGTASGGDATGDTFEGFESILGSSYNDTLTGDAGANTLSGGGGNDVLAGGAGADTLAGGAGSDTADYLASSDGLTVDLQSGTGSGGDAAGDLLSGIETVRGSNLGDVITGDTGANTLNGQGGSDTISGGDGDDTISGGNSADILSGGNGVDTLNATSTGANQSVNLQTSVITGGDSTGDVISGFENVLTGSGNDILVGSAAANLLNAGSGSDTLTGAGGADQLTGGAGNDVFRYLSTVEGGDTITDFSGFGAASGDRIDLSAIDAVTGGSDNAFLFGGTVATAHGVWYAVVGGTATVFADTDGNAATVEFSIALKGVTMLSQGDDFIL